MSLFAFQMDPVVEPYVRKVVVCLVRYAELEEGEALRLVNRFWTDWGYFSEDDLRLHEEPYYWAMCMTQSKPEWWKDSSLWPPPKDYWDVPL